jgi:hypothetical protein
MWCLRSNTCYGGTWHNCHTQVPSYSNSSAGAARSSAASTSSSRSPSSTSWPLRPRSRCVVGVGVVVASGRWMWTRAVSSAIVGAGAGHQRRLVCVSAARCQRAGFTEEKTVQSGGAGLVGAAELRGRDSLFCARAPSAAAARGADEAPGGIWAAGASMPPATETGLVKAPRKGIVRPP